MRDESLERRSPSRALVVPKTGQEEAQLRGGDCGVRVHIVCWRRIFNYPVLVPFYGNVRAPREMPFKSAPEHGDFRGDTFLLLDVSLTKYIIQYFIGLYIL